MHQNGRMLGVIGGSGFYTFLGSDERTLHPDTPYGKPSAPITIGFIDRARSGFPAPARRKPRILGAHRAVPGQHVGPARARCAAGVRAVRGRQPETRTRSRRRGGAGPAGRPDHRPRRHLFRRRRRPRRLRRSVLPDAALPQPPGCPACSTAAPWW